MGLFSMLFKGDDYASAAKGMIESSPQLAKNVLDDFLWRYPKVSWISYERAVTNLAAGVLVLAREYYGFQYPELAVKLCVVDKIIYDAQTDIPDSLDRSIFTCSYESISSMYHERLGVCLNRCRDWMRSEKYPAFRTSDAEGVIRGMYSTWALNVLSGTGLGVEAYDEEIPLVKMHVNDKCRMKVLLTRFIDKNGTVPYWRVIDECLKVGKHRGAIIEML